MSGCLLLIIFFLLLVFVGSLCQSRPYGAGRRYVDAVYQVSETEGGALEAAATFDMPYLAASQDADVEKIIEGRFESMEDVGASIFLEKRKDCGELEMLAQEAAEQGIAHAKVTPPKFTPLDGPLPQRVWTPTFTNCSSTFTDAKCRFFKPADRLWVTDLNELQFARGIMTGQTNLVEPPHLRQQFAQFLTMDTRSKKDPYTRASLTNDFSETVCKRMKEDPDPDYVVF